MSVQFAAKQTKTPQSERLYNPTQEEAPSTHTTLRTRDMLQLQRLVGNKGIQRLLAEGKLQRQQTDVAMVRQKQAQVQRQCTCGCCNGVHDEQEEQATGESKMTAQVQRFWDSDEEESNDSGGIMDWMSDTASQVAETVGGWFGGDNEVGDNETPPVEYSSGGVGEIPQIQADCLTEEGIGFGSGKGVKINLHGKTVANYDHAQPIPEPFPDGITVTTAKVGDKDVFSANGQFDVTFTANPSISLPTVPTGLTPCQEKAVQDFIDGKLAAHEQAHADAFTNNYNGTATLSINQKNILDTPDQRKRAVENPIQAEDVKRITAANAASGKLDPWNETVTGLDCVEPEESEE